MDSEQPQRRSLLFRLCAWWLTLILALVLSTSFAIAGGLIAILFRNPSAPLPIAVDSRCRILSSIFVVAPSLLLLIRVIKTADGATLLPRRKLLF